MDVLTTIVMVTKRKAKKYGSKKKYVSKQNKSKDRNLIAKGYSKQRGHSKEKHSKERSYKEKKSRKGKETKRRNTIRKKNTVQKSEQTPKERNFIERISHKRPSKKQYSKEKNPQKGKYSKKQHSKERHSKEYAPKKRPSKKRTSKEKKYPKKRSRYVGCYDDRKPRMMFKAFLQHSKMTIERCLQFCAKKGTRFAGLEFKYQCFCGNNIEKERKRKESECGMPCVGNGQQKCGGVWRISVYKVGSTVRSLKPKCHRRARIRNGKCVCKRGYYGDGINACDKSCTCMASGDPHYKTYDGQMIHFMGTCKYLLTKSKENNECSFSVEVKNERRGRNMKVAYTRTVDVKIYKKTVRIMKGGKVLINGQKKFLPVQENNNKLRVFRSGRFVQVWTDCGIKVNFDGLHAVYVVTPPKFKGKLEGICGDCNGRKDDFKTREGKDVSKEKTKFALIGDSYSMSDDSEDPLTRCETEDVPVQCEPRMNNLVNEPHICGDLQNVNGRFSACVKAIPLTAKDYYRSCVMDMCSYEGEPKLLNTVKCSSLESFVEECAENGIVTKWRTDKFCPLKCEDPNMVYKSSGPGCPATCIDPKAPSKCTLEEREGCFCKQGFVLSDDKCIKQSECGCKDRNGDYFPIGSKKGSNDCSKEYVCRKIGRGRRFVKVTTGKRCHRNALCTYDDNGLRSCQCKKGFIGDGYKICEALCGMKYKCNKRTRCVNGQCVCNNGLYGDGINSCEGVCTCTASGDPHYRTYDGQMIHFMGDCKYTLTKNTEDIGECNFDVEVKNYKKRESDTVSFTRYVEIYLGKSVIKLDQGKTLFINGEVKYLPFNNNDEWTVSISGAYLKVSSKCGISVLWDGISVVRVVIPKKYGNMVTGICGSCNGQKDDLRTREGIDVSNKQNKYSLIGSSYEVSKSINGLERESCSTTDDLPECSADASRLVLENDRCGLLKYGNQDSPFKECIQKLATTAKEYLESCVMDGCAYSKNADELNQVVCMNLNAFAEECLTHGFTIKWRRPGLCPIKCKENMRYSDAASGCPATCVDPNAQNKCKDEPAEGCECLPGYLLSDKKCVPQKECGCIRNGNYFPLNTILVSEDCTRRTQCASRNGESIFVTSSVNMKCHLNGMCGLEKGIRKCVCAEGFEGDGIRHCREPMPRPTRTPTTQAPSPKRIVDEIEQNDGEDEVTTPKPPSCNHPEPECSVVVRHDSCGTEIMLTGNCAYSNQFTTQCQYMINTGINTDGEYVADVTVSGKKTRLVSGNTIKNCATFSVKGSLLVVTEDTCERCILQFIRNMTPNNSCIKT
ncbi:unnamed protein product [Mytilus coruscus]|uniref:Zonadhesin n=1 Tax=Mytilus coruscus TaxID=42192 RepID=A0A6J8C2M9_MYTCO|nr:unnamed protein product [Mytilus coruscus]